MLAITLIALLPVLPEIQRDLLAQKIFSRLENKTLEEIAPHPTRRELGIHRPELPLHNFNS
jgi:hypothetical protein